METLRAFRTRFPHIRVSTEFRSSGDEEERNFLGKGGSIGRRSLSSGNDAKESVLSTMERRKMEKAEREEKVVVVVVVVVGWLAASRLAAHRRVYQLPRESLVRFRRRRGFIWVRRSSRAIRISIRGRAWRV